MLSIAISMTYKYYQGCKSLLSTAGQLSQVLSLPWGEHGLDRKVGMFDQSPSLNECATRIQFGKIVNLLVIASM